MTVVRIDAEETCDKWRLRNLWDITEPEMRDGKVTLCYSDESTSLDYAWYGTYDGGTEFVVGEEEYEMNHDMGESLAEEFEEGTTLWLWVEVGDELEAQADNRAVMLRKIAGFCHNRSLGTNDGVFSDIAEGFRLMADYIVAQQEGEE